MRVLHQVSKFSHQTLDAIKTWISKSSQVSPNPRCFQSPSHFPPLTMSSAPISPSPNVSPHVDLMFKPSPSTPSSMNLQAHRQQIF